MRIDQFHPSFTDGDAICRYMIQLQNFCRRLGFESDIFSEHIDPNAKNKAKSYKKMPNKSSDNIVLVHYSIGSATYQKIMSLPSRKILVYHNITPSIFFKHIDQELFNSTYKGRLDLSFYSDQVEFSLAASDFNKNDLKSYGFQNIIIAPIIIDFDKYNIAPDSKTISKYTDDWKNILFVGKIAPHKKQEDVIKSFYIYKKFINPKSRLFLIGSPIDRYYRALKSLIKKLELEDVYLLGHISFPEVVAYYRLADVFVCMSEHEGFCVPLLESMYFQVPIIAYGAAAIPETLADAGIIIEEKYYMQIAEIIDMLCKNEALRKAIIDKQNQRFQDFDKNKIESMYNDLVLKAIK